MQKTLEVTVYLENDLHDLLLAELSAYDFNAFETGEGFVKAYGPGSDWDGPGRAAVEEWLERRSTSKSDLTERWITQQNWNRQWEKKLTPVAAGPFLIKPTWTEISEEDLGTIVIEVDPKMTFGTGHHESTRLVLRLLPDWVEEGDRVLDAGAGTAVLSVAAVRLGASRVLAFDNHPAARANAEEILRWNRVDDRVEYRTGEIDAVPETGFSGILANINRNTLAALLPEFRQRLAPGGYIILSGLMQDSRSYMRRALDRTALRVVGEAAEGDWYAWVVTSTGE